MYWLTGGLLLSLMLAALGVAETLPVPVLPSWLLTPAADGVRLCILGATALLWCHKLNQRRLHTAQKQRIQLTLSLAVLSVLLLVASVIQALSQQQQAARRAVAAPMQVYALVRIEGISDSVGGSTPAQGYRQVARIHKLLPVTQQPSTLRSTLPAFRALQAQLSAPVTDSAVPAQRLLLSYYPKPNNKAAQDPRMQALNALRPNDVLIMRLRIQPLDNNKVSATGFDSYRWLKSRHLDGSASILDASEVLAMRADNEASVLARGQQAIETGRWMLRQHRQAAWQMQTETAQQASAVALSLLTGDRSLISQQTKTHYQAAGISHLLAISGTHVLFLAIVLAALVCMVIERRCPQLYRVLARWQIRWLVMVAAAFLYALFTGFDVPAARTAWLLLVIGLVRVLLLPVSTLRVLLALAVVMAWADPYVLWQGGYWLSFVAVALLLQYETKANNKHDQHSDMRWFERLWWGLWPLLRLQCWLFVALLPLTLLLFGKISLWGLLVNVVMIGVFGWVLVPLNLLAGVVYPILPALADSLWYTVDTALLGIHGMMAALSAVSAAKGWLYTPMTVAGLCVAMLALLPWLLPRSLLHRGWSAPPLLLLGLLLWQQQARLTGAPVLYVLPVADTHLSAVLLHYPSKSYRASWLFLADHRLQEARTPPSISTAEAWSTQLVTQIHTLGIDSLEGMVVQTPIEAADQGAQRLDAVATQIAALMPTKYYWQAGQQSVDAASSSQQPLPKTPCTAGQAWQLPDAALRIEAVTGWSEIDDAAVWDCSLRISSQAPIAIKRYNAMDTAHPVAVNAITAAHSETTELTETPPQTQLLIDASTHQRHWQLWSLLCEVAPLPAPLPTLWLGHSDAVINEETLKKQQVTALATYNDAPLATAWGLEQAVDTP